MRRNRMLLAKAIGASSPAPESPQIIPCLIARICIGIACLVALTALVPVCLSGTAQGDDTPVIMQDSPMVMQGSPMVMHESPYVMQEQCSSYVACGPCLPLHVDIRVEYLAWWTKNPGLPPMVTTSPLDTDRGDAGVLGQPGTQILFGDGSLSENARSGFRLGIVSWVDACRTIGFEFGYATLDDKGTSFSASGAGDPILARPFVNAIGFIQDAELVSYPDVVDGTVTVNTTTRFRTAELLLRKNIIADCGRRTDVVIGYRYGQLKDNLLATEALIVGDQSPGVIDGTTIDLFDVFDSENTFNGFEFGLVTEQDFGHWDVELLAKLALGNTKSRVRIDGSTTTQVPDDELVTDEGGLLAMPTNMGQYQQNNFGVMSELGARLNYEFACRWRASLGYTFLYWYHVARASDQIDTTLNLTQLPPGPLTGPQRPEFQWQTAGFWAHGLSLGLEYRY